MNKQKQEAIFRMKMLGIPDEVILKFGVNGIISRDCPSDGCVPIDEKASELIRKLEEEHGLSVYFVVRSETGIGEIDSYLYVGDCEEKWAFERKGLEIGRAAAYFCVYRIPQYSAFCTVGFKLTREGIRCTGRADL